LYVEVREAGGLVAQHERAHFVGAAEGRTEREIRHHADHFQFGGAPFHPQYLPDQPGRVGVAQRLCGGPVHQHEAVGRILAGRQRVAGQQLIPNVAAKCSSAPMTVTGRYSPRLPEGFTDIPFCTLVAGRYRRPTPRPRRARPQRRGYLAVVVALQGYVDDVFGAEAVRKRHEVPELAVNQRGRGDEKQGHHELAHVQRLAQPDPARAAPVGVLQRAQGLEGRQPHGRVYARQQAGEHGKPHEGGVHPRVAAQLEVQVPVEPQPLKAGLSTRSKPMASPSANSDVSVDSARNWQTTSLRRAPATLRTPISLARVRARATDRLV
jgi:hypothetical protein